MVFSSIEFLFYFLPVVLIGYFILKRWRKAANVFLSVMSLGFYAFGAPKFFPIMMASIVLNWLFGLWVDRVREDRKKAKLALTLMVVFNLGLLGVFKYLMFLMNSLNMWFHLRLPVPQITLPIGISFFTFQAMSYVIDVYRGNGKVQKNLVNVCLYISFFPQLIAGPIVRYETIADQIKNRKETVDDFFDGFARFIIGLSKKVLLANSFGALADAAFKSSGNGDTLSVAFSWLGAVAYTTAFRAEAYRR